MSALQRLRELRVAAARRSAAIAAAFALPFALPAVVIAARIGGIAAAVAVAVLALGFAAIVAGLAARRIDERWIARRLDDIERRFEDSTALLLRDAAALPPLQRLQQARLEARLADGVADLRPRRPWRRLALAGAIAALALAVAAAWRPRVPHDGAAARGDTAASATTALTRVRIDVEPPKYTKLPPASTAALDAKAPQGSRLRWSLRFDRAPRGVALAFHDGSKLELARDGDDWHGERVLGAAALYRIVLDGAPPPSDARLHRLDTIADRAPEIRVTEPAKTLTLLDAQQKTWNLAFEADDDYGIAKAELQVTLAQGTGENIAFKEQTIALEPIAATEPLTPPFASRTLQPPEAASTPSPASRARDEGGPPVVARYVHQLDLAALGLSVGDDVVVRVQVSDNREPQPNVTRSASFILRWPAEASSEGSGLEGVVQKTMPAYFRSQRQIIIDSEALLAERGKLDDDAFLGRSDAIGVDQKILRLRYGQFLGEEAESAAAHDESQPHEHAHAAPAKSFNEALHDPTAEARVDALADAHEAHERQTSGQAAPKFGQEGNTVAEYGHVHDIAEAATLLDPETKAVLKSALAEMWQAELHLRQGHPDEALPYEYRALDFVKQVQQSTRIYLARVGLELPPPDETRRLSGERKGLEDRVGTLVAAVDDAASMQILWQSLSSGAPPDWDAAEAWLRAQTQGHPETLAVLAALDRARHEPDCADCRATLRDLVWPLLTAPATRVAPRPLPDRSGQRYLDALQDARGGQP